jgi:hypothetical protein
MNELALSPRAWLALMLVASLWAACSAKSESQPGDDSSKGGSSGSTDHQSSGGAGGASGGAGGGTNGGGVIGPGGAGSGGMVSSGGGSGAGGTVGAGGSNGGVSREGGSSAGSSGSGGSAAGTGDAAAGSSGRGGADNCNLPPTVSFQRDIQPFLGISCGGTGCHVVDSASTMANGGYTHGYDWVTAGSHASSCPEMPNPKRFEVLIAVINAANPTSCSRSRKMPPPGATQAPLTPCQVATLQAWLDEPLVTQMHRADDSSPTTPYPMPPFN